MFWRLYASAEVLVADRSRSAADEIATGATRSLSRRNCLKRADPNNSVRRSSFAVRPGNRGCPQGRQKPKVIGRAGVGVDNVDVTRRPAGCYRDEYAWRERSHRSMPFPSGQHRSSHPAGGCQCKRENGIVRDMRAWSSTIKRWSLGMGRVGTEIARRAIAFGMRVIAYDPYLSASRARSLQVELVDRSMSFCHCMISLDAYAAYRGDPPYARRPRLALCRKGVRVVNCARGGLIGGRSRKSAADRPCGGGGPRCVRN
jgi:D-3-phosphoglycerate dehydrogenase